ncbi:MULTISPECIES: threonine aldolase family protein [Olivibacter]|jgi:threonine aldolase|uniref:Threonine aldolase n=3 Tax=Sphingobacteriaceae TaxID=84566 RepID=F4C1A5_SPHS2|nr:MULTISPECIES: aminotransferase class I/II-fold pyridoxal phosphate-dependent enzyme [Olivibacter]MCL4641794.1 aminotransferase class I/II-fold pyridoxal phosphate-dependent enzyme [Olivibacter sp. UJ_SKK_5.1]MDM8177615.1 aminotransferase class I/II-fold pyridoxal phosphate-dependent enzyme [Olivibacter sp. 47]MDX3912334.1 aminotransferase class I/II-fold pyridoxal phosphate-dependent enzyme [Pseudosphingobacterium sp.]QEL00058.1 aminotransferase class I/II-fold pyridoxal phosphate-dependent 
MKSLASDNYAGAITEVMQALLHENQDHAVAYGNDKTTERLKDELRLLINYQFKLHLVFNGTGANLLALSLLTKPYDAILCAETAHIYVDESTAPEGLTGCRLIPLPIDETGKLTPATIQRAVKRRGDLHHPQIKVLSITQPTEYGTLYTLDELRGIHRVANENDLLIHMDGSRLFTAITALNCTLQDVVQASGVDALSLGGTKSGMLYGEAVLVFNEHIHDSPFFHKRSMQLASKSRFISAQFLALLNHDTYRKYANIVLERTQQLATVLRKYPQIIITKPVEVNAIFAKIPPNWIKPLQETLFFYLWDEHMHEVRLMCSFDTSEEEISLFDRKLAELTR